jgi:hypothetical protein
MPVENMNIGQYGKGMAGYINILGMKFLRMQVSKVITCSREGQA